MFSRAMLVVLIAAAAPCARAVDLDRAMILTPPASATPEDRAIVTWQHRVEAATASLGDYEQLGWAFVAKARRTLDAGYYKLAEVTATVMDAKFGPSPEGELLRGHVDHNLHRFRAAEAIARRLVAERGLPEDWALASDALMEQGKLTEAIAALQRMADLKPGAEADTRIAHIRWLKGDLPGAIAAMTAALRETSPDDKTSTAWILSRLAGYFLQQGDVTRAAALADAARARLPDYPPALLAAGRVALARHAPAEAVRLLARAESLDPLPEYQWWLADARRAAGDSAGAAAIEATLAARGAIDDPRTYALFLATRRAQPAEAVRLARGELATRRDVFTHDALAWALFAAGDRAAAAAEIRAALAAGTDDPRLWLHAAVIARGRGDAGDARRAAAAARKGAAALLPSERALLDDVAVALRSDATSPAVAVAAPAPVAGPQCRP